MGINFDKLREALANTSQEELDKYFPKDTRPKGWVSIDEHLPMMKAIDIMVGGSEYRVRYEDGSEEIILVSDHNAWYYYAKDKGITHWWNGK